MLVVERELAGSRLCDVLAHAHPAAHRAALRQLLASGGVSVNGVVCLSDRRVRLGDVVMLAVEPRLRSRAVPAAAPPPLAVLLETATVLVVAKPAGVPTVPDRSGREPGVHGMLQALRPDGDLRIVHRLDRDTSGCLVLANGVEAARHFDLAFRERRVRKRYVALVDGVPTRDVQHVDAWLGPDRQRPGKVVAAADARQGFREARTEVRVRRRFRRHALLELLPATGRGHQLRVHLQSIGHPIVADADYGGEPLLLSRLKPGYKQRPGVEERPLLGRMFLHAERVEFVDVDGREVAVEAPLPDDLAVALRHVEKYGGPQAEERSPQCD